MDNFKRLPITQRLRVVSGDVSIFTTVGKVRNGIGDAVRFNEGTMHALEALERTRSGKGAAEQCATGLAGEWNGIRVQIDMMA